jgi:hypothetical protein
MSSGRADNEQGRDPRTQLASDRENLPRKKVLRIENVGGKIRA